MLLSTTTTRGRGLDAPAIRASVRAARRHAGSVCRRSSPSLRRRASRQHRPDQLGPARPSRCGRRGTGAGPRPRSPIASATTRPTTSSFDAGELGRHHAQARDHGHLQDAGRGCAEERVRPRRQDPHPRQARGGAGEADPGLVEGVGQRPARGRRRRRSGRSTRRRSPRPRLRPCRTRPSPRWRPRGDHHPERAGEDHVGGRHPGVAEQDLDQRLHRSGDQRQRQAGDDRRVDGGAGGATRPLAAAA